MRSASCVIVPLLARNILPDEPARLALGRSLRVTADQRLVGRLVAQDEQSLTLQIKPGKDPVVVPRERITTLERSLPRGGVALASSIVLVPLGTLIGVVAARSERWELVSAHRLAVRVVPMRGDGMTASASLRF